MWKHGQYSIAWKQFGSHGLGLQRTEDLAGGGGPPAPALDPDAEAFIARMSVAPSTEQQQIYSYFATQAKSIGVWDYIIDCGFLCAHDAQAAKLGFKDVINPTNVGTGPTHIPGWGTQGNGTNQALDTGFTFAGLQNDASLGILSLSTVASGDVGCEIGNTSAFIITRRSGTGTANRAISRVNGSASGTTTGVVNAMGFYLANRIGSAAGDDKLWKRGAVLTASTSTSTTPDASTIYIGGRNTTVDEFSTKLLSFWHIGTGIPEALIPDYDALVQDVCSWLAATYTVIDSPTVQTKSLYRTIIEQARTSSYILGALNTDNWYVSSPDLWDDIQTITGTVPSMKLYEWFDPTATGGVAGSAAQIADIKAHYAAGGLITVLHHSGNPVTGSFNRTFNGDDATSGNTYDLTGSPVVNCLTGGTERAEFEAYADRVIDFCNACVTDGGQKIPIILRFFHEIDGGWFWWSGGGTSAQTVQLWQDFVDRIKAAGVTNVLFDYNCTLTTTPTSAYAPGTAYTDLVSGDYYDDAVDTGTVNGIAEAGTQLNALSSVAIKPRIMGEVGYLHAAQSVADIWSTKTGFYHRDVYVFSAGFSMWRSPWGPTVGMSNQADFAAMVADASCLTRDRLTDAYTRTVGLT